MMNATPSTIQVGLVQYFLTPALLVLFQYLARTTLFSHASLMPRSIAQPVKAAYLLVGSASALIHLGIVSYVLFWGNAGDLSLPSLYLPDCTIVQPGRDNALTAGALLFFQWDFIIIGLTVVCHCIFLFWQGSAEVAQRHGLSSGGIPLSVTTVVLLTLVFGPGAGLAFELWSREDADHRVDAGSSSGGSRPYGT